MESNLKPEEIYRQKIDKTLERYFEIEREVSSSCGSFRIDYVLKCKESNVCFGLEVKSEKRMRGNNFGKYLKQASNYSSLLWESKWGTQKMLIFIAPAISNSFINVREKFYDNVNKRELYTSQHESYHEHSNVNGLIGQICNIGEIRSFKGYYNVEPYFAFIFRNKIIWSSKLWTKLHLNNYEMYNGKLQSDL